MKLTPALLLLPLASACLLNAADPAPALARDPHSWAQILMRYREPSVPRGIVEIAITAGPLFAIWTVMWLVSGFSYWLALPLAVPGAMFLVRLFMIQHDCGHGSFFRNKHANTWVGRVCGILTLAIDEASATDSLTRLVMSSWPEA